MSKDLAGAGLKTLGLGTPPWIHTPALEFAPISLQIMDPLDPERPRPQHFNDLQQEIGDCEPRALK